METTLLRTADYGNVSIFGTDTGQVFAWKHDEDVGPVLSPSMEPIRVPAGWSEYNRPVLPELSVRTKPADDDPHWRESIMGRFVRTRLRQWTVRFRFHHPSHRTFDYDLCVIATVGWDDDAGRWIVADPLPQHERWQHAMMGTI